jgi:GxxExxY protein
MAKNPAYHGVMYKYSELTEEIIGAFFAVYNALGYGFLEKVYVNALKLELERRGLKWYVSFRLLCVIWSKQ